MPRTPIVCLCDTYDLKEFFGPGFAEATPGLELLSPGEVTDPASIRAALGFWPKPETVAAFPNLRMIVTPGAGVDGLSGIPAIDERGITVVRMLNPAQNRMMAGFAAYHVIGWHRELWAYEDQQREEVWRHRDRTSPDAFPVGVLGFGEMGQEIARGLATLGYPVTAWATRARDSDVARVVAGPDGLEAVLSECRAIVNVLPLTEATRLVLNAETLAKMRPDAMLLQIGRGGHLDHDALIPALDAGRPGLAVLDVTEPEPLPKGHPFWRHPKIRITPHVASLSSPAAVARHVERSLAHLEAGEPIPGTVDMARGY